jgi:hypothetical protein
MISNRATQDESVVDEILANNGTQNSTDSELRPLLLELRSFAHVTPPPPSDELSALMQNYEGDQNVVDLQSQRRRRRATLISVAVISTMGLGVGAAAAASPDFRAVAERAIIRLIQPFTGSGTGTEEQPAPSAPQPESSAPSTPQPEPAVPPEPTQGPPTAPNGTGLTNKIIHSPDPVKSPNENAVTPRPSPSQAPPPKNANRPESPGQSSSNDNSKTDPDPSADR